MRENMSVLNVPDFDAIDLQIAGTGKTYKLVFDYAALYKFEQEHKRDLKKPEGWKDFPSSLVPSLVYNGLRRNHPEITVNEVIGFLNPAAQSVLTDAIFELLFPGITAAINEAMKLKQ